RGDRPYRGHRIRAFIRVLDRRPQADGVVVRDRVEVVADGEARIVGEHDVADNVFQQVELQVGLVAQVLAQVRYLSGLDPKSPLAAKISYARDRIGPIFPYAVQNPSALLRQVFHQAQSFLASPRTFSGRAIMPSISASGRGG